MTSVPTITNEVQILMDSVCPASLFPLGRELRTVFSIVDAELVRRFFNLLPMWDIT
jgi:hypothetical protein